MFRIYSVFSAYEDYLKWQKENILNEINPATERWRQRNKRNTTDAPPHFQHLTPNTSFSGESENKKGDNPKKVEQDHELESSLNSIKIDNSQGNILFKSSQTEDSVLNRSDRPKTTDLNRASLTSNKLSQKELLYKNEMQKYQEDVLIKKSIIYFLAPSLFLGLLSIFFPLCYALVPAHESGLCFCTLQQSYIQVQLIKHITKVSFLSINTLMFYGVNWVFLLLNIIMLYRIRHINDRLKVREEMGYIVKVWTLFCYV